MSKKKREKMKAKERRHVVKREEPNAKPDVSEPNTAVHAEAAAAAETVPSPKKRGRPPGSGTKRPAGTASPESPKPAERGRKSRQTATGRNTTPASITLTAPHIKMVSPQWNDFYMAVTRALREA